MTHENTYRDDKIQKGYIKFNYVVCLSDPCSSQSSKLVGGPVPEASKKYGSVGRFTVFGTYVFKSKLYHFLQMSAFALFMFHK
jgi:hypothetical protein